jgi:hypothetical protein
LVPLRLDRIENTPFNAAQIGVRRCAGIYRLWDLRSLGYECPGLRLSLIRSLNRRHHELPVAVAMPPSAVGSNLSRFLNLRPELRVEKLSTALVAKRQRPSRTRLFPISGVSVSKKNADTFASTL